MTKDGILAVWLTAAVRNSKGASRLPSSFNILMPE